MLRSLMGGIGPLGMAQGGAAWPPPDWWTVAGKTCVRAYQAKGAPSLADSYINLANPGTGNATAGVAPTFDTSYGWASDGTKWLATGAQPAAGWTALVRFSNFATTGNIYLMGEGAANANMILGGEGATMVFYNGLSLAEKARVASGVIGVAGAKGYLDGVVTTGNVSGWTGGTGRAIYIFGFNNGTPAGLSASRIQAFALYSDTLTAGEVATVSTAMAAL